MAERTGGGTSDDVGDRATHVGGTDRQPRFAMLLGGFHPPARLAEMASGQRPSNDVRVLAETFAAEIFDFGWLEAQATRSWRARLLLWAARRTDQWSAALALASSSAVDDFDVVYVSGEDVAIWACAANAVRRRHAPKFVVRIERPVYGRTAVRRFVHRRMFAVAARRISVAVCRTSAHGEYLRTHTRLGDGRVMSFGQEVDTDFFAESTSLMRSAPVEGEFILSAGLERRDYGTLLKAVEGLPLTLVIAAGSPWSKDRFHSDRDLPDNVVVGSFDHPHMRELYRRALVVVLSVLPTDRACGMNVIGEAWAMGRPVVATATTGLREFITSGDNGVLVPPGDAAALREAIKSVLESPSLAAQLAARGRTYVRSRLSLEQFRATVEQAAETALRVGSGRH